MRLTPLFLLPAFALLGCPTDEPTPEADPTISIDSPLASATVALGSDADQSVDVAFTVTGFTLAAPGSCGETENCGHVHLTIDGTACNADGAPYNNAGGSSPLAAKFATCATPVGAHEITVALHDDDHGAVLDAEGAAVADAVSVTTTGASGSSPAIHITSPSDSSTVTLQPDANASVPIEFTVENFTLMAPGSCAGAAGCGHVHLLIDDTACNQDGAPYNNAGAASPIEAHFAGCAVPSGAHSVTLELHDDGHALITDGAGLPAADTISVTTEAQSGPSITIDSPANESVIAPPTGAGFPVPISFTVQNFTLMAPGSCGTTENCGHVHVLVDADQCNMDGAPYNNAGAASPVEALLGNCTAVLAAHDVKLVLHNDDHSVHGGGDPIGATVRIHVEATEPTILIRSPVEGESFGFTGGGMSHDVEFEVGGFTLMAPGSCGSTADCGHVHMQIDGDDCNQDSLPYNAAGFTSPMSVNFGPCTTATGAHQISAALHTDDHSALTPSAQHSVNVTVN